MLGRIFTHSDRVIDRAASKRSRYRATHSASDWPLGVESLRRGEPGWYFVPRTWLALGGLASAALTTGGFGLWIYARYIEPRWIDWHVVTLPVPGLPSAFDGYKIVHLSDLHLGAGAALTPARLKRILQRVNRYRPDLIAITGDFASHLDSIAQTGIAQLATLRAPDGIFCVPGNHDSWSGIDSVMEAVAAAGCRWLINAHHLIQRKGAQLAIAGIDDPWDGQPDLARALYGIPPDSQVILLAHAPNVADAAIRQPGVVVQLSGHTHGGQLRIPGIGPLVLPDQSWRYPSGLYHVPRANGERGLWVNTNRGLGVSEMPLRFACRPEVTIITLKRTSER